MATVNRNLRTIIVGTGPLARLLMMEITAREHSGYKVIGMVAYKKSETEVQGCPLLGTILDLPEIIRREKPETIIVSKPSGAREIPQHQLLEAKVGRNMDMEQAETVYEALTGKLPIEALSGEEMIFSDAFQPSPLSLLMTRILSLGSAVAGLLIFAPLLLLTALWIKLDSKGPVLFVQERVGLGGKSFELLKFRTMHPAERKTSEWAGDNIHRITRAGHWLRKFRLDELPQLINVIRGDMNLVGPRPHPACNFELFVLVSRNMPECGVQIPYYTLRTRVRPGITGWAQVRYRYANNLNEEIEKLRFDLYYLKHYSFWLDLRILYETIGVVFYGHRTDQGITAQPGCEERPFEGERDVSEFPVPKRPRAEKYAD